MKNDSKEKADEELKEYFKTTVYFKDLSNKELDKQIKGLYTDHFRQLLLFTPMDYLPKINCKVLAINGTKDLQVTSAENLAGINKGLKIKENLKNCLLLR
jgi:precorrin-6B methylase 1